MKKILIALVFLANVAVLSSCERDRCPAHGDNSTHSEQAKRA